MSHFAEVGETAAAMVVELTAQLAGPDQPAESYLGKVGRLNAARLQAEEIVRAELLTPPPAILEDLDEGDLMGPYELWAAGSPGAAGGGPQAAVTPAVTPAVT